MATEISGLYIRRSGLINAPPARVWQEFTSLEKFGAWFSIGHELLEYDPSENGRVRLRIKDGEKDLFFGGVITNFEPNKELTFSENWEGKPLPVDCFITFRLTPHGEQTHIELFHHGIEGLGEVAASELAGHERGWHTQHLEALKNIVEKNSDVG